MSTFSSIYVSKTVSRQKLTMVLLYYVVYAPAAMMTCGLRLWHLVTPLLLSTMYSPYYCLVI